ncbi:MAG: CoB--CoM heterodisulfide reductase iron-sulfur subunit B family protein, partial [Anaerolineaceae bacterium]
MPLEELADWQCCGATFPLATENSMSFIAPTRLLTQAQNAGGHVTTLCAICFHVLRRSQHFLHSSPEMLERINLFTEEPYDGQTRVSHFLELLRDDLGWGELSKKVTHPLKGVKLAPYYGCLLLRPYDEVNLDDPDDPRILHDLLAALGAEVIDFPYRDECCGSFLAVSKPDVPKAMAADIVESARRHGAQALVTACPLCQFNLDYPQRAQSGVRSGRELPVVYFTQVMAAALGLPAEAWGMDKHYVDPQPLFQPASEPGQ